MLNLETLVFDLPEDVLKRKWAGDFEGEIELIDALLERDLPQPLKERLKVERKMAQLLPGQFCIPRPKALEMLREKVPDFKDEELDALELDRAVEYIYVHGEKHYLRSFRNTLLHANPAFAARAGVTDGGDRKRLDAAIAGMKAQGGLAYRIRLCGELRINDEAFVKGAQTRVHMPLPQRCAQQSDIELNVCASAVDAERAPQRTAYFERMSSENEPFRVEYAYRNAVRYVDPLADGWNGGHVYPDALPPMEDDLAEQYPHIAFTPYLKALARELMGDETDPVRIAWRFYDYITTHVRYSYMRSYFLIERHAEFCALNGKGDCGIQAILFITLCRIAGIPARWQSGLYVEEKEAGSHDWAQFYVEPFGWLFCDPSFGGSAHRAGAEERRRFYFGNLDPFRMVANSRYQTDFNPPKACDRWDPYDNQDGEVEQDGVGLLSSQFDTEYRTLELKKIDE